MGFGQAMQPIVMLMFHLGIEYDNDSIYKVTRKRDQLLYKVRALTYKIFAYVFYFNDLHPCNSK
ncbi:hypothetical protein DUE52_23865 [Larkinella punicea]|uniref:Uncharacterized protein n=1 Tax=Larkinella punicea TaxID=2315727 RepID=A0A368JK82_9BACT|nr:hypothetical protein DUE52_23865 [Larkinella punicea]